ncbi:hypothetical protein AVEN_77653-1 [Araneus ventricosus]|uniref:Tc1-like transposase DDE domain-containing protein n=1 Tax=Araneus ventricosus TaxID=182803 RepID=A0A4Y2F3D0_ARAVE|nr:hypothetical protein AVEN_77653-1 [Araneus ventricosus]
MSACELLNGPSLIWAFGTDVPLVYRCWLYGTQLYASPGPANATIELLMAGNKLPGLTSLVSNCIGWMDMYWYGDNLMNPWTQHVNRELFNLQDSATPHSSRVATKWLQEHSSDFRHFHCPPNSPDMNIIEPIWVALQCAVQKRSPPPGTPLDLRTALQDSWRETPPGYLQTLVDTMPLRVASLLCAGVGPKRY